MSWAKELKDGLHRARHEGGEGPILDAIENILETLTIYHVTGLSDLGHRLDRRDPDPGLKGRRETDYDHP